MNAQALEDLRGVDYLQAWYRWWFSREVPYRGAFKIKTGAQVMFVKMICQWTRIISTENGSHKIFRVRKFLFIFLKKTKR
jgi:hypothetical protein